MSELAQRWRLQRDGVVLSVIDVQERLVAAMLPDVAATLLKQTQIWLGAAAALRLPVVCTQQYPKGLGQTHASLAALLPPQASVMEKIHFDCTAEPGYLERLTAMAARDVVLVGMEAHVCVLQTAMGLLRAGLRVWVAEDAVCSRRKAHWRASIRIMENAGAVCAPTETLLFALLGRAGSAEFKAISQLVK